MANRGRALILVWIALGGALLYAAIRLFGRRKAAVLAHCEYWIYLPGVEVPAQEVLMKHLLTQHARYFGKNEGLVFSDIRFHMSLVLRDKNPHAFRPDLFEAMDVSADVLKGLASASSFIKIRFLSEDPLLNRRHLRFLAYLAAGLVALGSGSVVYDLTAMQIWSGADFSGMLAADPDAESSSFHVTIRWSHEEEGFGIRTQGNVKVGEPEIESGPFSADQRVIVTDVVNAVADAVWSGSRPSSVRVDCCDDEFEIVYEEPKRGTMRIRILRRQSGV